MTQFYDDVNFIADFKLQNDPGTAYQSPRKDPITGKLIYYTNPRERGRKLAAKRELWVFTGQSNIVGFFSAGDFGSDLTGTDSPDPRIKEISQGVENWNYRAAPSGELQILREVAQDANSGSAGTNIKNVFAKHRLERHPEIEEIIFLSIAKNSSGFYTGDYNIGDPHYESIITFAEDFLSNNPDVEVGGFVSDQGATDGRNGYLAATFKTNYTAMVADLRDRIPRAEDGCWVFVRIPLQYIQLFDAVSTTLPEIDDAMVSMSDPDSVDYIPGSILLDTHDMTDIGSDGIHWNQDGQRVLGRRCVDVVEQVVNFDQSGSYGSYIMRYDPAQKEMVDINGSGAKVIDGVYDVDPELGPVLHHFAVTSGPDIDKKRGYDTSMQFRADQPYTKIIWFKRYSTLSFQANNAAQAEHFISGKVVNSIVTQSAGHVFSRQAAYHRPPPAASVAFNPLNTLLPGDPAIDLNRWMCFGLVFTGTEMRFYFDGVQVGSAATYPEAPAGPVYDADPHVPGNRPVEMEGYFSTQIGAWGDNLSFSNPHGATYEVRLYNGFAASAAFMAKIAESPQ